MHDPMVVAFQIPRPWPKRERRALTRHTPNWSFRGKFWTLGGRLHLYWPSVITVWHIEPGGADSGEICKHYRREQQPDGKWKTTILNGWKFHVHHWRIQVSPLQSLRRWLLTRCEWCGGPSRKGSPVNVSHQWDAPRGHWWQGEPGVYHVECSSAVSAHRSCICDDPLLDGSGYGKCALCGLFREFGRKPEWDARIRELKQIPANTRPPK